MCSHCHSKASWGTSVWAALTLPMYIVCHHLQSMDPRATCSHLHDLGRAPHARRFRVGFSSILFSFAPGILDIWNVLENNASPFLKNICAHNVCDLIGPPPHTEIIWRRFARWIRNCSLLFRRGWALQNPLITTIIFDIALSRDLRQLQTSPWGYWGGRRGRGKGRTIRRSQVFFFPFLSPLMTPSLPFARPCRRFAAETVIGDV